MNEPFLVDVIAQLNTAERRLRQEGYLRVGDYSLEASHNNTQRQRVITRWLQANRSYVITGACDRDCTDMDLIIYDGNDIQVAVDVRDSDRPEVEIQPRWTGQFKIVTTVPTCNNFPCYHGIGIFGK